MSDYVMWYGVMSFCKGEFSVPSSSCGRLAHEVSLLALVM